MYRREFLGVTAASASTAIGTQLDQQTTSTPSENGQLVVIYDDAPIEDYNVAFPIHRDLDVPACVAPVSNWVGTRDGYCNVAQLQEMKNDAGFEVLSQTRQHTSLTASDITVDIEPEDTKIYPAAPFHAYHPNYTIEITDGNRSIQRKVARSGEDENGVYIELANPVDASFDASNPDVVERYPPETLRYILSNSQAQLRHMGFRADSLIAPYDRLSPYVKKFAKEYYHAIGNSVAGTDGLNDPTNLDPYELRRWYFIENGTRRDRFHRLDTIARENTLGIFGAHTFKEGVTKDKLREVLEGAIDRGIELVTLRDALQTHGVITPTQTATPTTGTPGNTSTTTSTAAPTTGPSTIEGQQSPGSKSDNFLPALGTETLGGMAIIAGIGASLSGWHFLKRD